MTTLANSLNRMMDDEIKHMISDLTDLLEKNGDSKPSLRVFNTVKASMVGRYTDELEYFAYKGLNTEITHSLNMIDQILQMEL